MRGGRRGGGTLLEVVGSTVGGVSHRKEELASSGTGSKRAQGRERSRGDPSASPGPREPALLLPPDEDPLLVGVGQDPSVLDPDAEIFPGPRERREENRFAPPPQVGGRP